MSQPNLSPMSQVSDTQHILYPDAVDAVTGALPVSIQWPVLERMLDPWPLLLAQRLQAAWGLTVNLNRDICSPGREADLFASCTPRSLCGIVRSPQMAGQALLVIDPVAVFTVLEFVLGNRQLDRPAPPPKRPCSPFEANLMRPLATMVLESLSRALKPAGELVLNFESWVQGQPATGTTAAARLHLDIGFGPVAGAITLILPVAMLAPLSSALSGVFQGDEPASAWRARLQQRIVRADVSLTAVLHRQTMELAKLRALKVGDRLIFDAPPDPVIALVSDQIRVAEGRLGHSGGHVAIKLDAPATARKEQLP